MTAETARRVLYLTPLSHFSRKVRIVLRELSLAREESFVPDLPSSDPADFGGNPVLRVPVLRDGYGYPTTETSSPRSGMDAATSRWSDRTFRRRTHN